MRITSYVHPMRTLLPCTGAGRHINNVLLELASREKIDLELLFSQQWLENGSTLSKDTPLHRLPFHTFPMNENSIERFWKLTSLPPMDRYVPNDTDWLFAPMETYFPIKKVPSAITIFDIQAFEPCLPWSQSLKHRWFRYKWGRWVRRAIAHSRVVFTISEFSKQRMISLLGANPDKIVNIGCGVEHPFFEVGTAELEEPTDSFEYPYVFMIGGLREKKGADHFISVAKKLKERESDIRIVIAGSSESKYIEEANNCPNITLLGIVPDQDLPNLLKNSICLLFLSLYEGFGIPPLEAMAAGVPAVVANRASLPEVVGDAGIVVNPESPDEIVDTLLNLQNNSALLQDYVQRGRDHVEQYTWSNCVDKLITAFEEFS